MELKKKIALVAAGSLVGAGALFVVITNANAADTSTSTAVTSPTSEANDPVDANEANDPADAKDGNWAHDENDANDAPDANEPADTAPEVAGK